MIILAYLGLLAAFIAAILLIWRKHWVFALVGYVARDEMPIWLSIGLAIAAAAGTYWIAPLINQDFEFQKNRSAHLLSTVTDINKDMVSLVVDVRKFNEALFYKDKSFSLVRGDLLDKITEIQWRLLDVDIIISRAGGNGQCVQKLRDDLSGLNAAAKRAAKPEDQEQLISESLKASQEAQSCLLVLYKAAKLD